MGKMTLYLVIGFSLLYMIIGNNSNRMSSETVRNMADYNANTVAHSLAVSAANLACNEMFLDNNWTKGISKTDFLDGEIEANIVILNALKNIRKLVATGTYGGVTKTVEVIFQPSKFSKFAYYSVSEGGSIWWTGNDTVWGPFHTQDYMRVYRHPVFYGKASTKKKLIYYTNKNKDKPRFFGGFEQGVDLPLPTDGLDPMKTSAQNDGLFFTGHDSVYITFVQDSLKFRFAYSDKDSTVHLPSVAPGGVIFAENSIMRLKGTVKGQYSVACSGTGGKGNIYLDDDIVYTQDPLKNKNSTDLLGIVAKNKVLITDNAPNHSDINIHASIYSEDGGFGAQNYSSRPISGNINLIGGIIQHTRQAVGTFGSGGIKSGFAKRYKYDERFMLISPPMFPGTGGLEIVSWYE
ncbi:MAG: hypothetical protein HKP17_10715 [Ignavibacteriaceae bacterium]|nr:hypothetical protein [Ignavibacteriaceae bacterium]